MPNLKIASWNVYFSHKLIGGDPGSHFVAGSAKEADSGHVPVELLTEA